MELTLKQNTKSKLIKYLISCALFFVIYYLLVIAGYLEAYISTFTYFTVQIATFVMNVIGFEVQALDNMIYNSQFSVMVNFGCEGSEPMIIYTFAVLAFPVALRSKLKALAIGLPLIYLLNIIRMVLLFNIGLNHKEHFDLFHHDIFPFALIACEFMIWFIWIRSAVKRNAINQ